MNVGSIDKNNLGGSTTSGDRRKVKKLTQYDKAGLCFSAYRLPNTDNGRSLRSGIIYFTNFF